MIISLTRCGRSVHIRFARGTYCVCFFLQGWYYIDTGPDSFIIQLVPRKVNDQFADPTRNETLIANPIPLCQIMVSLYFLKRSWNKTGSCASRNTFLLSNLLWTGRSAKTWRHFSSLKLVTTLILNKSSDRNFHFSLKIALKTAKHSYKNQMNLFFHLGSSQYDTAWLGFKRYNIWRYWESVWLWHGMEF